jgi:hypothetical protein
MSFGLQIKVNLAYLQVGKRGVQPHAPIDQPVGSIDNAIFVQPTESLDYCF